MRESPKYSIEDLSFDALFDGRILLYQPKKGYRFSVDSPLLTWFSCQEERPALKCVDLGCGCGVIGISLLVAQKAKHVVGVEIQPRLAELSLQNAHKNRVANTFDIIVGDLKNDYSLLPDKQFDLVVSNPPFWPSESGRLPPDEERRIAKHEISITLDGLVQRAKKLLHPRKGRFCIAFPAIRLEMLFASISGAGMNVTRLMFVHPNRHSCAELVLIEARVGRSGQLKISPPLYLKNPDSSNSAIASEILSGAFNANLRTLEDLRNVPRDEMV